jgi:hypothetical protein
MYTAVTNTADVKVGFSGDHDLIGVGAKLIMFSSIAIAKGDLDCKHWIVGSVTVDIVDLV